MGTLPPIRLQIEHADTEAGDQIFTRPFRIGRDIDCEVTISDSHVSRNHVEIDSKDNCWWIHDLQSTNGLYLNGKKVSHAPVMDNDVLNLGQDGPRIVFKYLSPEAASHFNHHRARERSSRKPMKSYRPIVLVLAAMVLGGFGFFYGRQQLDRQEVIREKATTLYSDLRATEVAISTVYAEQKGMDKLLFAQQLNELENNRRKGWEEYKGYLIQLGLYQALDDQESQIYNVARFFNENELAIPISFIEEVKSAIFGYWLEEGESVLQDALNRAQLFNYTPYVVKSLEDYGLPIEFFYLPVSISGFQADAENIFAGGHKTAGIWQLSEASGAAYGLKGLSNPGQNAVLPVDDRHDFMASTRTAVKVLHEIYQKEAFGSGLLALAIYLQHEQVTAASGVASPRAVLAQVQGAENTRDIWSIRQNFPQTISDQVYEQVVKIFAAAVIAQDPPLFGLDIITPTAVNTFSSFR